ncbi:MFS transporter, partial [Streptomyces sp. NPDC048279]|uniref:MFS transporter n=1 Tax=Streptomyces sp. NPDC048279 TaxID=3154714 RepID=UPI00342245F2
MTETVTTPAVRSPSALGGPGLFTVLLAAALPLVDFFIVNVALPTIGTDLHASEALLELVVAGYGVAYAVLLVLGGRLGDLFGRRRLFLAGGDPGPEGGGVEEGDAAGRGAALAE